MTLEPEANLFVLGPGRGVLRPGPIFLGSGAVHTLGVVADGCNGSVFLDRHRLNAVIKRKIIDPRKARSYLTNTSGLVDALALVVVVVVVDVIDRGW